MAKYSNVIEYNIITDVDTSGITKLQNELVKLKQSLKFDKDSFNTLGFDNNKIDQSIKKVNQLQNALTAAFNPKIGTLDLSKLNSSLQKEHTSLQMIVKDWESMGARGNMAISSLSNALLSMNKGAVTVNTTLSKIANTFSNTVRWGITASIFQEMMSSVQGAVSYMKDLDESLTQIQMVTNSSKENMRELAQYANNAAQALGSTTTDYTNAVKVFVQEGFSEKESKQYANLSTKLANVSEQNTATTSDQITAFRNAFQLDYEQTVAAMDKVANVANNTASNVNELMTASQRAASVAQAVGTSQDSFLAAIATIESVTRQSAEEIGNGLKTIYQRFADIKTGKSLEDGVQYGQYANALKSIGVDVLDAAGEFKGMDQILEETQEVWSSLSDTMKVAVGEKVAGKFQYNRFAALMNNQAYYEKALAATGEGSEGMMDQMNEIYTESIEGRLKTLQAAGEQVMSTLFNQDDVEPVIETLTNVVNAINDIVDAAGGLQGVLPVVGGLLMRTFSTEIAGSITNIATSIQTILANSQNAREFSTSVDLLGLRGAATVEDGSLNAQLVAGVADNYSSLSESSREKLRDLSQQILQLEEEKNNVLKEQETIIIDIYEQAVEEQRLAKEKLETEKQELGLDEEEYEIERAEIQLLEMREKENGNLSVQEKEHLEVLKDRVAFFEKESTNYDEIVQKCSIYNEKLLRGEKITGEELNNIRGWRNELNNLGINTTSLDSLIIKMEQLDRVTENTERTVKDILNTTTLEARLNNITRAIGALSSAFIGIQMLGEMFKTLTDETATAEEKFTAFTMSGLMGISMLLPAITDFVKGIAAAKEGSLAFAAAEKIRAIASAEANAAMLMNPYILAAMAAIAVAALAIAAAYETIYGAVNKANAEFEKQKDILKQTKNSYQALSEKVEDLDNKMKGISDTKQSLSEIAQGTEEWKNKVAELNDQVYELLEAYPELIEYVKSEGGVLSLDTEDSGYIEYITSLKNQKLQARQSVLLQQGNVKKAENNAQLESFKLKYGDYGFTLDDIANKSIDDLKNSLDSSKVNYENIVTALSSLKQSVDATNVYLNNIDTTAAGSLGYSNYAGTKISDYENVDLSKYQITSKQDIKNGYGGTNYSYTVSEWDVYNDKVKEAIKQQYADLKDVTDIVSNNIGGISFKYTNEENKQVEKALDKTEVESILKTSLQSAEFLSESFNQNGKIFELFGAKVNYDLQEIRDSAGNLITSLDQLDNVTQEQASIMNKMNDESYNTFMSTLYGSPTEFAKHVKNNDFADSTKFANQEVGLREFLNNESFQEAIQEYYPEIDTVEEFANALDKGIISVDGLSEALDKLVPQTVDLAHNINGNEFTNRIDFDEEGFDDFLKEQDMSKGAFNRMARDASEEEGGYYDVTRRSIEELIDAKQEDGIVTEAEAEEIEKLNSKLEGLDDAAKDSTAMILRMSNGVVKLREKFEDISEVLSDDTLEGTVEWYEALDELDQGLSEVLNIDAGTLSDTFLESGEALDYARRMAEGDMTAIDDLRRAASEDIIQHLAIQTEPGEDVEAIRNQLMIELQQLQADIDSGAITVTTDLDTNPFIQKLNDMLAAGQISAEQASNILSSIGMDAQIKHAQGTGKMSAVEYEVQVDYIEAAGPTPDGPGWSIPKIRMVPSITQVDAPIDIPYLEGAHYTGSGVQTAGAAARNPSFGNKGGGKGSSPKKGGGGKGKNTKPKDYKTSEWDYLTDITNDLNRAAAAMEKLTKLEDRLFGKDKISNLKKLKKDYAGYINLLQKEVKLAERHAKKLRTSNTDENGNPTVRGLAKKAGMKLKFDKEGNIENGRKIEIALLDRANKATEQYNKHRNDEDPSKYEDAMEKSQKDYDSFLKAYSEYEDTLGKIEEGNSQIQEYFEKLQDAADEIVDAIQDGIDGIKDALEDQRNFNKTMNDWRNNRSDAALLNNQLQYYQEGLENFFSNRVGNMSNFDRELKNLKKREQDAKEILNAGTEEADKKKLSQTQAWENLKEATEVLVKDIEAAIENYNGLIDIISEASDKMDELIDDRLEAYDNIVDTIDNRLDQLALLFGDNYGAQTDLYGKRIDANMSKLVDINTAIEAKQASIKEIEKLKDDNGKLSVKEQEILKKAQDEVTKLQKEQISTETSLLQDIAKKLTSQTNESMQKAINSMFGGNDVKWISQQWEMATRNSNQYLDDYNRAFEIQKLQLKYQDLLSNSQNASALIQHRITESMNEQIGYLQNKKKMSEDILAITEYDVKYAEKQLEILQRQIALEEAQNNKSQMRLQRDAAGNYSFVYGADEDSVNQATQALLNAQQEAYNMSKQMYEDTYESAYQAALKTQEMVVSIATDASLSVAERSARIQEVINSLNDYMVNSSSELGEISINLYNDFIEAEALISDENLGHLQETFDEIRRLSRVAHDGMEQDVSQYNNSTLSAWDSIEARNQLGWNNIDKTTETYLERIKKYTGAGWTQLGADITAKLSEISKETSNSFIGNEGSVAAIIETALTSIDDTFETMKNNSINSVEAIQEAMRISKEEVVGKNGDSGYLGEYQTGVENTLDACGSSYETFISESLNEANDATLELNTSTETFNAQMNALQVTIGAATTAAERWKGIVNGATTEAEEFINKANEMEASLSNIAYQAAEAADQLERVKENSDIDVSIDYTTTYTTYHNDVYSSSGGGGGSSGGSYGGGYSGSFSGTNSSSSSSSGDVGPRSTYYKVYDQNGHAMGTYYSWSALQDALKHHSTYTYKSFTQFATGGYTGTWFDGSTNSKNGKLAILHEKELVLNQEDTKNMLSAVEIVRDIMSGINSSTSLGKVISQNNSTDIIEQRVEIQATFPGVTEVEDIKQALIGLADSAYQYANKYQY